MKLKSITIENFRAFKSSTCVDFNEITAIIGKNDSGKSTILEALEIFFNNDIVKIDQSDLSINADTKLISLSCDFTELPNLTLDSTTSTTLESEYLTIDGDTLRIKKVYDANKKSMPCETFIVANHPNVKDLGYLHTVKESELKKLVKERKLDVPLKGNPGMRKALWNSCADLQLTITDIPVTKEDAKQIWSNIEAHLPIFALFQSDRSSTESDDEVQNPMKTAIREAIAELKTEIDAIQDKVKSHALDIAQRTHAALSKLDSRLAASLAPRFTPPADTKWQGLFNIGLDTDEGISLNKRGSGVRRLILISFFVAEAERRMVATTKNSVIYAIEEPETAQHPHNQKILIDSLIKLSQTGNTQLVLTTHSPALAEEMPTESIRFVTKDKENNTIVRQKGDDMLEQIVNELGVLGDRREGIKLIFCVEGPTDVIAMKSLCRCLRDKHSYIADIESDPRICIIPLGGSILKYWIDYRYLRKTGAVEVLICDNDVNAYSKVIENVNERIDGSWGVLTKKYEIENYLHSKAIEKVYGFSINTSDEKLPERFGEKYSKIKGLDGKMGANNSKKYLSRCFEDGMTYDLLCEVDPEGEVKGWFDKIGETLTALH